MKSYFKKFYLLLHKDNLLSSKDSSKVLELRNYSIKKRQEITDEFYTYYRKTRIELWKAIVQNNPEVSEQIYLKKTQKILDRITFIRFCEDQYLLPANTLLSYVKDGEAAERVTIWLYLQELFRYIDRGNSDFGINKFNGELFKYDAILDSLYIPDKDFVVINGFFNYNFREELSVDILGHIFEQSISDLEELKGQKEKTGKRKKDGVFYTPEYVTQYIVENSIGKWLENKREELGLNQLEDWNKTENKGWRKRYINDHISKYIAYQNELQQIKVLDPACGSGAFLTSAFDYLYRENVRVQKHINYLEMILKDSSMEEQIADMPEQLIDIDKNILKKNLYGVDLNKESVEITKLSLWIKTANRNEPLTALDKNILVGNSVIDDPSVDREAAFQWEKAFPEVFEAGGFDVIIGNPPYVPLELMKKGEKKFLQEKYSDILVKKWELSVVFIRKCADLIKDDGFIALIVPITWQTGPNYYHFRNTVFSEYLVLDKLLNLPYDIFPDAYVDTCILVCRKHTDSNSDSFYLGYKYQKNNKLNALTILDTEMDAIPIQNYLNHYGFKVFASQKSYDLHTKISSYLKDTDTFCKLGKITKSTQGPVESAFEYSEQKLAEAHYPYMKAGQGYRYFLNVKDVNFINLEDKPSLIQYYVGKPKIFFRRLINRQDRIVASYYEGDLVVKKDLNPFYIIDDSFLTKYVLALVNSKLLSYIYINFSSVALKDDFRQTTLTELRELPIRRINIEKQKEIIKKVDELETIVKDFHRKKAFVSALIKAELGLENLSYNLRDFFEMSLSDFIAEVKRQNNNLSFKSLENLNQIYLEYQPELSKRKRDILSLDAWIDHKVYEIYKLDKFEINEIEDYYSQFNDPSSIFQRDIDI